MYHLDSPAVKRPLSPIGDKCADDTSGGLRQQMGITCDLTGAVGARGRGRRRTEPAVLRLLVLVGVSLLVAACGGGSASPGVAKLGSKTKTTSPAGGVYGNSGSSTLSPAQLATLTAFANCVRKHGLPSFPDPPYSNGELNKLGFRKLSPQMESATRQCHSQALAAGVVQTPAELQQHLQQMLKIAQCMRAHGVPNFPDPNANGGFALTEPIGNPPGYAAAAKACGGPPGG